MNDILLLHILKNKGILTDNDMHSLDENEHSYLSTLVEHTHIEDSKIIEKVKEMYHICDSTKYIGEKYSMDKAKEVHNKYKSILGENVRCVDVYFAINSHYHDYIKLFKNWFTSNIDDKIIESALVFWFMDDDCSYEHKIKKYFN